MNGRSRRDPSPRGGARHGAILHQAVVIRAPTPAEDPEVAAMRLNIPSPFGEPADPTPGAHLVAALPWALIALAALLALRA
jgi:hypothetical protein